MATAGPPAPNTPGVTVCILSLLHITMLRLISTSTSPPSELSSTASKGHFRRSRLWPLERHSVLDVPGHSRLCHSAARPPSVFWRPKGVFGPPHFSIRRFWPASFLSYHSMQAILGRGQRSRLARDDQPAEGLPQRDTQDTPRRTEASSVRNRRCREASSFFRVQ